VFRQETLLTSRPLLFTTWSSTIYELG